VILVYPPFLSAYLGEIFSVMSEIVKMRPFLDTPQSLTVLEISAPLVCSQRRRIVINFVIVFSKRRNRVKSAFEKQRDNPIHLS
jgi:hypothetical protein